jgi:hypothetical protein
MAVVVGINHLGENKIHIQSQMTYHLLPKVAKNISFYPEERYEETLVVHTSGTS